MLQSRWLLQRILFFRYLAPETLFNRQVFSVVLSVLLPYGTTGPVFQEGEVHWQLYSFCSQGYLQNYLGTLNARGVSHKPCSGIFIPFSRLTDIQLNTEYEFRGRERSS